MPARAQGRQAGGTHGARPAFSVCFARRGRELAPVCSQPPRDGGEGGKSPGPPGARGADAPQPQGEARAHPRRRQTRGPLPAGCRGWSPVSVELPAGATSWQRGRDPQLPRLTLAPLLCSEVLGRTSEESGGSEQESASGRERATQIPRIMSPEEGDGGLCLRREPCFYWRGLKGL